MRIVLNQASIPFEPKPDPFLAHARDIDPFVHRVFYDTRDTRAYAMIGWGRKSYYRYIVYGWFRFDDGEESVCYIQSWRHTQWIPIHRDGGSNE